MRQGSAARGKVVPLSSSALRVSTQPARSRLIPRMRNLLLIGCIVWALWTYFFVQLPALHQLNREKADLSNQLSSMQQDNSNLGKTIANLGTDAYIERIARQDYNMIKPGDILYQHTK
ncbi:MAG: hypothetical protein JWN30_2720 [Bacilli bacterium]|nr:hypothetical protein [Bacilli bacterium]